MQRRIIIEPQATRRSDQSNIRSCVIKRTDDSSLQDEVTLWYQLDQSIPLPSDNDCDAYLLALLMDAMQEGRDIELLGSVSKELVGNLIEFQGAWHKWRPDLYQPINIRAQEYREDETTVKGAICAFSGGVDATFSVWRHSQNNNGLRSQNINLCVFVHGFDIPLNDENAYLKAKKRSEQTLQDIDISLFTLKTNYREISKANWEHTFAAALAAALTNYKRVAGTCIIGSSEPYDSLVIPWGSSPITEYLLSSEAFKVMHDGATHSRTEKVKEIIPWQKGVENLRVCWQGDIKDRNCGECEKCIRTKVNFLAAGSAVPNCFPPSDIFDDLKRVKFTNNVGQAEWSQIYRYTVNHNIDAPWVSKVKKIANQKSLQDIIIPPGSRRKEFLKALLKSK